MQIVTFIKWTFTAIGTGMLAVAMYQSWSTHRFISRAVELRGEVIALIPSRSSKGGTTYSAEVTSEGIDERPRTIVSAFSTSPPAYDVGEAVVVLHDPQGEHEPQIRGFFSQWGVAVIAGGMGTSFLGVGLGMMFGGRRR